MVQNAKVAGFSVIIVAVVLGFILMGRGDDEQQIHDRLDKLEELGSKPEGEGQLQSLGTARQIANCFTEQAEVRILPGYSYTSDRKELTGMMVAARNRVSSADVSLGNRSISISEDGQRATVITTGTASVIVGGSRDRHKDRYRMEFVKLDDEWLISSVEPADD